MLLWGRVLTLHISMFSDMLFLADHFQVPHYAVALLTHIVAYRQDVFWAAAKDKATGLSGSKRKGASSSTSFLRLEFEQPSECCRSSEIMLIADLSVDTARYCRWDATRYGDVHAADSVHSERHVLHPAVWNAIYHST